MIGWWFTVGMLAHIIEDDDQELIAKCGTRITNFMGASRQAPRNAALCAACYEADRREK